MADAPRGFFGFARQALAANPTLSPMTALVDVLGRAAGPALPQIGNTISDAYRDNVPAQYRLLLSSMLGNREPITNRDYSPADLATLRSVVARDQAAMPGRAKLNTQIAASEQADADRQRAHLAAVLTNPATALPHEPSPDDQRYEADVTQRLADAATRRAAMASRGEGAVGYNLTRDRGTNYGSGVPAKFGPFVGGAQMADPRLDALVNTLGAFVYRQQPDGSVTIDDNYNWNASRARVPQSLPDALQRFRTGDLEALPAYIMPDAAHGRPVHIVLPPQTSAPPPGPAAPNAPTSTPSVPGRFGFGFGPR